MSHEFESSRVAAENAIDLSNESCWCTCPNGFERKVLLPLFFFRYADQIRDMEVRSDDIWVCSFPRTGTTWTQEMVWCVAHDADLKTAEEYLPKRFPFLEYCTFEDVQNTKDKNMNVMIDDFVLDSVNYVDNLPSPRFIKTHLPFEWLPEKLQKNETTAKIVYVVRNARDTCLSYFHHCKLVEGYRGEFEEFCKAFLAGNVKFGPFSNHVMGYWERRNGPNVLILKYEDMKKDLKSSILKLSNFLGKTVVTEQMSRLLDHLSFQSMKNNRAVNYEPLVELLKNHRMIDGNGCFLRCGQVGKWRETMSLQLIERFEKWEKENLNGLYA